LPQAERAPIAGDETSGYQPLSILSIVGCALAILYAVFLAFCWLISFLRGTPLLMSSWTLLLPLAGLVVSAVAWLQIKRAEGSLAGSRLATSGMLISGLFGLMYGAYMGASYLALRQQGETFTNQWMELVRDAKFDEAFRLSLPANERPRNDANLHRELEIRFNTPGPNGTGAFTVFQQHQLVRLLNPSGTQESAAEVRWKPLGLSQWEYKEGAYHLQQLYEVSNAERKAEVVVTLVGNDSRQKQEGRQWAIMMHLTHPQALIEQNDLGGRLAFLKDNSGTFVHEWIKKLMADRGDEAFLDTVPPPQRADLRTAYQAQLAMVALSAGLAPGTNGLLAEPEACRQVLLPGYEAFTQGSMVSADDKVFWAPEKKRDEMIAAVKALFQRPGNALASVMRPQKPDLVWWRREGDHIRIALDCLIMLDTFSIDAAMIVETDAKELEATGNTVAWRLAKLELYHGRSLAAQQPQAPGMPPRPPGGKMPGQ
jgi:hypothetical protein